MLKRRTLLRLLLVSLVTLAAALVGTIGGVYAAGVFNNPLNGSARILASASYALYEDAGATRPLEELGLGNVTPGANSAFRFYIKNTGQGREIVSQGDSDLPIAGGHLRLAFNGAGTTVLSPGQVALVEGALVIPDDAPPGGIDFGLVISAVPVS